MIAGCDGFHGICRAAIPDRLRTVWEREYPYAWLGILAEAPPATDELIYAHHRDGFALHSMRNQQVSKLYLQVDPDARTEDWPEARIWAGAAGAVRAARLGGEGGPRAGHRDHPDAQLRQRADAVRTAVPGR